MRLLNNPNHAATVGLSLFSLEEAIFGCVGRLLLSLVVDTTPSADFGEVTTYTSSKLNTGAGSPSWQQCTHRTGQGKLEDV